MSGNENNKLAGIEYSGLAGSSQECLDAVLRLLQYREEIARTRILSCSGTHCLLLSVGAGDFVAVKSGFGSGYPGEGAHAFSYVLSVLDAHGSKIEECEVGKDLIQRLDDCSLTWVDINTIVDAARPIGPSRWRDYVFPDDRELEEDGHLWREFRPVIPFAIVDNRIVDLALSFWENPDEKLMTGYRRLEDIVRSRTGIDEYGTKLFSPAFRERLGWRGIDEIERNGRANLFASVYMAYRNPRAHRELKDDSKELLAEFLLLNHLYLLEKKSIEKEREGAA